MFIYAFLFGYSFWIQYDKANDKTNFSPYWNKRMFLLAGFGILHILFLSFGDILLPYAILGLSLPFFARFNNTKILFIFLIINLVPFYEFILRGLFDYPTIFIQPVTSLEEYIAINGQGSWIDIFKLRLKDYFSFTNEKVIMYIPKEMSLFLLGMLAARVQLATTINIKKGSIFCVVAVLIIAIMYFFRPNIIALFDYEGSIIQRILLGLIIHFSEFIHGLFYIIGFLLLWKIKPISKILMILSYTGKLSLTNYIMQSLVCVIIFSGFGYYGQLTPIALIICTLIIYLGQLLFSVLWLKYNKYGPLEYIWRKYSR